jgi:AraC family transcriptional regulator
VRPGHLATRAAVVMNQNINLKTQNFDSQPLPTAQSQPLNVVEVSAAKGQWDIPAAKEVSLGLSLSNFSARWRGSQGFRSEAVSAGTVAICELDRGRSFEMRDAANFAVVLLRNEVLQQVAGDNRYLRTELRSQEVLQDLTLRQLMKVLVRERRAGFPSGTFFLDGVATALASYLVRHYSTAPPVRISSSGGMAPSILRRSIELMEARLEKNLRLNELAQEAGLSASHFIRSFRQSTGKTPYQFLLHRRVERARDLMRDDRASLTEVALSSGFADQHHLARVFRRITNLTPSDYRRSLQ